MLLSIWDVIAGWFTPLVRYVFRCVICGLELLLRATDTKGAVAAAQRSGWTGPKPGEPPGWRCPICAGILPEELVR